MTVMIDRFLPDRQIEARAAELLRRYGRKRGGITRPPVPVEEVADFAADVPITWDSIPDRGGSTVLAKLVIKHPRPEIVINADKDQFFREHEGAEQYSVAHELGHYVLHVDQGKLLTVPLREQVEQTAVLCRAASDLTRDRKEWQAERFAAYLLLPEDLLRAACAGVDVFRWTNLYELKRAFQVSITALMRRLEELRIVRVAADRTLEPCLTTPEPGSLWQ